MDIKIISRETGKEEVPQAPREEATTSAIKLGDLMTQQVGQMFDFKPSEVGQYKDQINTLIEYAKTCTEDRSPEAIKWAIRSLQGKVGTPPLGEKWVTYLTKYAYLKLEGLKLQKEVERYEHNNNRSI